MLGLDGVAAQFLDGLHFWLGLLESLDLQLLACMELQGALISLKVHLASSFLGSLQGLLEARTKRFLPESWFLGSSGTVGVRTGGLLLTAAIVRHQLPKMTVVPIMAQRVSAPVILVSSVVLNSLTRVLFVHFRVLIGRNFERFERIERVTLSNG